MYNVINMYSILRVYIVVIVIVTYLFYFFYLLGPVTAPNAGVLAMQSPGNNNNNNVSKYGIILVINQYWHCTLYVHVSVCA